MTTTAPPARTVTDKPYLLVMDVDSTLIDQEVIELLADQAGSGAQVAAVTARAMNGELDFAESLRERVATLAGLPVQALEAARSRATLTRGARGLVSECHARGWTVALVSGGFEEVVRPLAAPLGITEVTANRLEVVDGRLTGRTVGPVVDAALKAATLRQLADSLGIPLTRTVAVGDGANDLLMMETAAVGVAFCAKPHVRERVRYQVTERDLRRVLAVVDDVLAQRR